MLRAQMSASISRLACTITVCLGIALSSALAGQEEGDRAGRPKPQAQPSKGETPAKRSPADQQRALLRRVNAEEAWEITRGDPKVLVGIIDNGFDFYHPDLKGQLTPGYYYPGGYHDTFYEGLAHGTLVASLIVAKGDRPDAMVGLAPRCRAMTASQGMIEHTLLKIQSGFFREHPQAKLDDLQKEMIRHPLALGTFARDWIVYQTNGAAEAIRYLVDHDVRVINLSGGLCRHLCRPLSASAWDNVEKAFAYAAQKGVVIVLAAGNNAERWEDYPGDAETVIVAGACRLDDTRWEQETSYRGTKVKQGSNFGKRLTAMAPVEDLVVCMPHEKRFYESDDGPMGATKVEFKGAHDVLPIGATSSAAPIVTALVALIRSARPDLDARQVVAVVQQGCDDIGAPGFDDRTGHGRVNFGKTLRLARDWKK
jgi:subtilisin family serine protease